MTKTGQKALGARRVKPSLARSAVSVIAGVLLGMPLLAYGQVQDYSATATGGAINGAVSCATANRLTVPITVPDSFTVDKLNLGFLATHTWRGDIELSLTPPDGAPTIQLINSDVNNIAQDHYNIELDDIVSPVINNAPHNTNDSPTLVSNPPPEYENLVRPDNVGGAGTGLAAFSGEQAAGTWTLSMCDAFPTADDGNFVAATLFFIDTSTADLSLSVAASTLTPDYGTSVDITYTVTNAGPGPAATISVDAGLPSGLDYVSQSGTGSFAPGTGVWTLPSLAVGASASITLSTTVLTAGSYQINSEITASSVPDPDSTPGNNSTTEDDDDTLTLSPVSVTVPPLACAPGDQFSFVWDAPGTTNGWNPGDLTNSFTVNGNVLDFTVSGDTQTFLPRGGVTIPATTTEFTGGGPAGGYALVLYVDFTAPTQSILVDIDVGEPNIGLGDVQFAIYDVDLGGWTDRIEVEGFLGGQPRSAILTPSTGNQVVGNAIVGTGGSTSTQANGNSTVTFGQSVDRIRLTYSNDNPAADPARQVIGIRPLLLCPAYKAELSAAKTVEMYDPSGLGGSDIYAVPGAEVLYKIAVTNAATATAPASDITLNDVLPDNLRFVSASVSGFTGGSFGSPALPAANTDCDSGACVINYSGADLAVNTTGEIQIRAVVK